MGVQQSIAVPAGRAAGLAYLRRVVEDAKASLDSSPARSTRRAPAASPSLPPRTTSRSERR